MKDTYERLRIMHKREHELRHIRDGTSLIMRGGGCTALAAVLTAIVGSYCAGSFAAGAYTGAILADESAGGYVLVAVIAFMVGAGAASFLIRRSISKNKQEEKEKHNK